MSDADAPTAELTVSRTLPDDLGERHVTLYLDGQRFASLRNGESVTRRIRTGRRTLKAHNTLNGRTIVFEARPGERLRFVTGNRPGFGSWMVWVLGAGPVYVALEPAEPPPPGEAP